MLDINDNSNIYEVITHLTNYLNNGKVLQLFVGNMTSKDSLVTSIRLCVNIGEDRAVYFLSFTTDGNLTNAVGDMYGHVVGLESSHIFRSYNLFKLSLLDPLFIAIEDYLGYSISDLIDEHRNQ